MVGSTIEGDLHFNTSFVDCHPSINDNVWDADFQFKDGVRFDNGDSYLQTNWANLAHSDLERSARRGSTVAQACLSHMYQEGIGVKRDPEKAFKWCAVVARQNGRADAMYELGLMYLNGQGVAKCASSAYNLFKRAAEQNHPEALFRLAEMRLDSSYGEVDAISAFKTCLRAAKLNLSDAQFNVGVMFEEGIGTTQNFQESIFWYAKAAENGNKYALNNLGDIYFNGRGVPEDKDKAEYFFRVASDRGSSLADFNLAIIHSRSEHDEVLIHRSLTYLFKAAFKGVEEAKSKLKQLNKMFPVSMLLAASSQARAEFYNKEKIKK